MIERPSYLTNRPISGPFLGEDWILVAHTLSRENGVAVLGPAVPSDVRGVSDLATNVKLPEGGAYEEAELVIYLEPGTLDSTPLKTHEVYMQKGSNRYRVLIDDDDGGSLRLVAKQDQ